MLKWNKLSWLILSLLSYIPQFIDEQQELTIIWGGWAKHRNFSVTCISIVPWSRRLRQTVDLQDTDKSCFFPMTKRDDCFIIRWLSLFRVIGTTVSSDSLGKCSTKLQFKLYRRIPETISKASTDCKRVWLENKIMKRSSKIRLKWKQITYWFVSGDKRIIVFKHTYVISPMSFRA